MAIRTVLLVEDDRELSEITFSALTAAGFDVKRAYGSAAAAAVLLSGQRLDLLLVDVMLPGPFDGVELVQHGVRLLPEPHPAVIFVTGLGDSSGLQLAARELSAEVITKPCRPSTIVAAVRRRLGITDE